MSDRSIVKTGMTLGMIAAVCTSLVAATYQLTKDRIAANEKALLEQSLQPALTGIFYDSGVSESRLVLQPPHGLPGNDPAIIYRVFAEGEPAAALFVVTARDGFAGPIRIVLGVEASGSVTGVRILQHRETPGLGDKIVSARSDWVYQFDGRSMGDPQLLGWALKGDGGEFDQLTGASITPRAVIKAIRDTLVYFDANRDAIFQAAATEAEE
ncbi:MAG: electron transport complex subunit RsxG [Gammaproteobacteria bacterium]|nr:electron transport complex subunit RsxG [Gammaproteobacteria bacterium]MDH3372471.1 electron transport complex subunit RsxG [Gammaproteobacteria bacterium]MDH3407907.1 electron transport complex subunit RsxG [Gammaproteobacteria bacterium]MDH3551926.1 electron transport complex subunit RsxG [Gammaproteobacteria bacterium]